MLFRKALTALCYVQKAKGLLPQNHHRQLLATLKIRGLTGFYFAVILRVGRIR